MRAKVVAIRENSTLAVWMDREADVVWIAHGRRNEIEEALDSEELERVERLERQSGWRKRIGIRGGSRRWGWLMSRLRTLGYEVRAVRAFRRLAH